MVDVTGGLRPGGWVIVNALRQPENLNLFSGFHLACVDATGIAIRHRLGTPTHPIINTAMIGAFTRVLEMPPLELIFDAIKEDITIKPQQNIMASKDAYERVQLFGIIQ